MVFSSCANTLAPMLARTNNRIGCFRRDKFLNKNFKFKKYLFWAHPNRTRRSCGRTARIWGRRASAAHKALGRRARWDGSWSSSRFPSADQLVFPKCTRSVSPKAASQIPVATLARTCCWIRSICWGCDGLVDSPSPSNRWPRSRSPSSLWRSLHSSQQRTHVRTADTASDSMTVYSIKIPSSFVSFVLYQQITNGNKDLQVEKVQKLFQVDYLKSNNKSSHVLLFLKKILHHDDDDDVQNNTVISMNSMTRFKFFFISYITHSM